MDGAVPHDRGAAAPPAGPAPRRRASPSVQTWLGILGVIGLVAATYGQALRFEFVLGDHDHVLSNRILRGTIGWREVFTSPTSAFLPQMPGVERVYRPLLALSLAGDWAVWGLQPGGFHLSSVLAHLVVVLLLWCIAWRLTASAGVAFAAAALLAVHPAGVEAVVYVAARMDLYVTLAMAATVLLLHGCLAPGGTAGGWRLLEALLCFLLGLGSKETAVIIPVLVAWTAGVYPEWFGTQGAARRGTALAGCVVSFWVVLGCYLAFRFAVIGTFAPGPVPFTNVPSQALRALAAIGTYAQMVLVPGPSTGFILATRLSPPSGIFDWPVPLGLAVILLVGVGLLWLSRHHPVPAFALGWAAFALAPAANFLPIYWEREIYVAERSLYPALPGWCLFVAVGVHTLLGGATGGTPGSRRRMRLATVAAIGLLSVVTSVKVGAWHDDLTLWRAAFVAHPGHLEVRLNMAAALAQAGDLDGADAVVKDTMTMAPGHPDVAFVAGWIAELRGERAEALRQYELAIALGTGQRHAVRWAAMMAARLQEWDRAARWFAVAAQASPQAAWPEVGLGWYYEQQGRNDLARVHFERAIRLEPASPERPWFLGQLLAAEGCDGEALQAYRAALALDPSFLPARRDLAILVERQAQVGEARDPRREDAGSLPECSRGQTMGHLRPLGTTGAGQHAGEAR